MSNNDLETAYNALKYTPFHRAQFIASTQHVLSIIHTDYEPISHTDVDQTVLRVTNSDYWQTPARGSDLFSAFRGGAFSDSTTEFITNNAYLFALQKKGSPLNDLGRPIGLVGDLWMLSQSRRLDTPGFVSALREIALVSTICKDVFGFDKAATNEDRFAAAGIDVAGITEALTANPHLINDFAKWASVQAAKLGVS